MKSNRQTKKSKKLTIDLAKMTIMHREIAMTSPTVNINRDVIKRVSNFSVASLLADTKTDELPKNLSLNKTDQYPCDKSDNERKSPCSSIVSEEEFESMHDDDDCDSIVDVEDLKSDKSTNSSVEASISSQSLIRPTPFSALAAAAWGIHGWPRQMPFRPPEGFSGPNASKFALC